jgi:hypothetical protein
MPVIWTTTSLFLEKIFFQGLSKPLSRPL